MRRCKVILWALVLLCVSLTVSAQIVDLCSTSMTTRSADFNPTGIILTYFDGGALWVYDIARNTRYPLPETVPCVGNCRVSPDFRWITYLNPQTLGYFKMRFNGTQRTPIMDGAADVLWWSTDTFLVWTIDHRAFLQKEGAPFETREYLPSQSVVSIQPQGRWAIWLGQGENDLTRYLVNLQSTQTGSLGTPILLSADKPYFNGYGWSSDGSTLAYVAYSATADNLPTSEIFLIQPGDNPIPRPLTQLTARYGAVRINGASPAFLSWSPDNSRIAFWVIPMTGQDPASDTGEATLHIVDVASGQVTRYCGFATSEHTPNPPHLVWSPDGSTLAFGGNITGDNKGYLLLTLDVATGQLTEMSDGIFPALGAPDVLAWGLLP